MLLVHNEIHYVPIGDGWEEVLVHICITLRTRTSLCTKNTHLEAPLTCADGLQTLIYEDMLRNFFLCEHYRSILTAN